MVDINSFFDKIFYINLDKDYHRNAWMLDQFAKHRIKNFERISAVQLGQLPHIFQYRNFIKRDIKYTLGSLACRASHIKCVKLAHERNYKRILILEDDVQFLVAPDLLLNLNSVPLDWDMLYFGGLIEQAFRNQIVCAHAYGLSHRLFEDIIFMAEPSGMEIDNFYAKIIQHMSYNYNTSGKYNIRTVSPFNYVIQQKAFHSNIQGF